jgi:predicted ester cyclase
MDEPALLFGNAGLSAQKEAVRVFYKEMWDHADKSLIPTIFHPDFTFRGSLGPSLVGFDEFAGYVDWVTGVFGQYTTDILAMIEEGSRVSGKMRFHGFHREEVFGVPPSGRHVWWIGMPIFTFDGAKVRDLYVLGDIHGLIGRLRVKPKYSNVQPLQYHHQPSRDHRAVPGRQSVRRQPAAHARSIP